MSTPAEADHQVSHSITQYQQLKHFEYQMKTVLFRENLHSSSLLVWMVPHGSGQASCMIILKPSQFENPFNLSSGPEFWFDMSRTP